MLSVILESYCWKNAETFIFNTRVRGIIVVCLSLGQLKISLEEHLSEVDLLAAQLNDTISSLRQIADQDQKQHIAELEAKIATVNHAVSVARCKYSSKLFGCNRYITKTQRKVYIYVTQVDLILF